MAIETITCPHCGLILKVETCAEEFTVSYDGEEWRQRCKHLDLGSPGLCLAQEGEPSSMPHAQ
jgi:hypothetical protein